MRWSAAAALLGLIAACDTGRVAPAAAPDSAPEPRFYPGATAGGGWVNLLPASDTRHVYVSSSSGNDNNSGLSEQSPKATIQAAVSLLRQSSADWLHIKRGDTFVGGMGDWYLSGRSLFEPMVVTTYGTSPDRPLFLCGTGDGLTVHGSGIQFVGFFGLHFVADTYDGSNGQPYGVSLLQPSACVLFEDCAIERFFTNLRFQGPHRGIALRRSLIADAFTVAPGHAQGIYVEQLDGLLIEECVFDHNGWNPSVPGADATIYRHNLYIQGNTRTVFIRGNIIARAGSHGLQARSGGDVRNNLFLGNSINLLVGNNIQNNGSVTATVVGNVMLDGKDINGIERRGWAAQFQCLAAGEIALNVAAHQVNGTAPQSYEFDSTLGVGVNNVNFHHNVAYKWGAPLLLVGNRFAGLTLRDNDVQEPNGVELFRSTDGATLPGLSSLRNRWFSGTPTGQWMFYTGQYMSLNTWRSMLADGTSSATRATYPGPEQRIGDYDLMTGGTGSLDSFLARARRQSRMVWDDALIGTNAAAHFRANFGLP